MTTGKGPRIFIGINSFFEHPAVVLLKDDRIDFAIEDERLTGIKHGRSYSPFSSYVPFASLYKALEHAEVSASDIIELGYSYHSISHLRALFGCLFGRRVLPLRDELTAYGSLHRFRRAIKGRYEVPLKWRDRLSVKLLGHLRIREWDHHRCHAASSFFCSPFERSLVVVADGRGEGISTSVYLGDRESLRRVGVFPVPHSLGFFYTAITQHLGFEPFSDEYKVMGMAAYAEPNFADQLSKVLQVRDDGYRINMYNLRRLTSILGPARLSGENIEQRHIEIASSAQKLLQDAITCVVKRYIVRTGERNLCLAGGVFLNCVAVGKLYQDGLVDRLFVQPASHDAGTALGAALLSRQRHGESPRIPFNTTFLGSQYSDAEIESILIQSKTAYRKLSDDEMLKHLVNRLVSNALCGVFRGRMEFGPRALGNRSILAAPFESSTITRINNLKGREQFRPIAPVVTDRTFKEYFDGYQSPFMVATALVRAQYRERLAAITHADNSARCQCISEEDSPFLYKLLVLFGEQTGIECLTNTSLNFDGKPILERPFDAISQFFGSGLDTLVIGSFVVDR